MWGKSGLDKSDIEGKEGKGAGRERRQERERERFQQLPQDGSRCIIFNNCTTRLGRPLVKF